VLADRAGFRLRVEIIENLLARPYDLLEGSDLHQLTAADRVARSLQGDDQFSPLLSELDEWEPVINQLVHLEKPLSQPRYKITKLCLFAFRNTEHFKELLTRDRGKGRRALHRRPSLAAAGSGQPSGSAALQ